MLKFLSGVSVGWIAARVLPPKPPDEPVLQLPSAADFQILAEHVLNAVATVQKKLNEKD